MTDGGRIAIRRALESDVPLVLSLIRDLAEYEKLGGEVKATEEGLRNALFGPRPAAEALIASFEGVPAGFALFFQNFSTFAGRPGLYLEDIFVKPEFRGHGIGGRLMAHLARIAVERDYGRMEWAVLDWNETARRLYRRLGGRPLDDWTPYRLTGESLTALASTADE
jgi:GNAT superfamily N-acetyltransferase